jgi:hypothetical protein
MGDWELGMGDWELGISRLYNSLVNCCNRDNGELKHEGFGYQN